MTRDEIIKLAREAGLAGVESPEGLAAFVFRFAALVAAAEREACTKVCDAASEPRRGYDGQTDELLEALSGLIGCIDHGSENPTQKLEVARAAIAKATGETK